MKDLIERVNDLIDLCWRSFSAKVGGGLIAVNKEASMQLHFAYVLKNASDLVIHHADETITIELETDIPCNGVRKLCDIVVKLQKGEDNVSIPIELKCYKEHAASGGKRGALDIFCKDIYKDLEVLELYSNQNGYSKGILLAMTDMTRVVHPVNRKGKYWDYDISNGTVITGGTIKTTPIGGDEINIELHGQYTFNWKSCGKYYFVKLIEEDIQQYKKLLLN